jgi:hypothetical protein
VVMRQFAAEYARSLLGRLRRLTWPCAVLIVISIWMLILLVAFRMHSDGLNTSIEPSAAAKAVFWPALPFKRP